ncbi:hypothetical protein KXJ76_12170 [Raoultella ornithinolytica]|uniref:hypothetical protein n=1 Tax=Raoultella ornithinolytica TaxID=54291 RepID=UPI001C58D70C|nr:hypothetical protein [Raoultella ornithinolytica]QXW36529.1 hypothetical protein KXJ76_12170 [Raoultella ornithinolytica]
MRIKASNGLGLTINGLRTTGIDLANVRDTTIKNCIFYENGKVQGEAIFDLVCENNARLDSSEPSSYIDSNKNEKKIKFVFGFWKYTMAYLRAKNYNPYGD